MLSDPPYFLEFLGKDWDTAGVDLPVSETSFRAWLAGLVAGEGYFMIQKSKDGFRCSFGIHMRADEAPLLKALQKRTGIGKITSEQGTTNGQGVTSAPSVRWVADSQADCRAIASLLQGSPLYGKKQRDFEVWCKALDLWKNHKRGASWDGMAVCYEELRALRPFDADLADSAFDPFIGGAYGAHYRWATNVIKALKPGAPCLVFGGTRTYHRLVCALEDAGFEIRDCLSWLYSEGMPKGKGNLKPAWEPIILARKPLSRGQKTPPLNVDGCRLESGRWPSNVILDELAATELDESTPHTKSTPFRENTATGSVLPLTKRTAGGYSDSGGVSRFFYVPKASKADRGEGNEHPTVKPTKLTAYLAELLKTPGNDQSSLLVPFCGSGSEIVGAVKAGWSNVTGIELDINYVDLAKKRLGLT